MDRRRRKQPLCLHDMDGLSHLSTGLLSFSQSVSLSHIIHVILWVIPWPEWSLGIVEPHSQSSAPQFLVWLLGTSLKVLAVSPNLNIWRTWVSSVPIVCSGKYLTGIFTALPVLPRAPPPVETRADCCVRQASPVPKCCWSQRGPESGTTEFRFLGGGENRQGKDMSRGIFTFKALVSPQPNVHACFLSLKLCNSGNSNLFMPFTWNTLDLDVIFES